MRMAEQLENLVFGLDIGTRNVVGTVGYKDDQGFHVIAQNVKEHDTRAMLDGQIHDINRVAKTVSLMKQQLEEQIGHNLEEVCIAAAGRVLKTVTVHVDQEFPEEILVTREHLQTLDLLGVEQAHEQLMKNNDTRFKFYCVGYTTIKYYLDDDLITKLENHKAEKIGEDLIVTFLPEDVVDGLYTAVGLAGLEVANLTLEPIAAIKVAIPESYRMLNIALVDVGAGTSDICITKDGSIIAYGMIPSAGDEISELIVQHYLVDFNTAEEMKLSSGENEIVVFKDIMGIEQEVSASEIWELIDPMVEKITKEISAKIIELNGDKSVSAVFVVGGGGKVHNFTEGIATELGLVKERVALRGEEVLKDIDFIQEGIVKDPLIVTPIGICLNYFEHKNSFIFVRFNDKRVKLYNNNHLTVVDAAMNAGFHNEDLFPRRGKELNFTVNGKSRIVRGELGESAVIKINGKPAGISTPLEPNAAITIEKSTIGKPAECLISQLPEYTGTLNFLVNNMNVECPLFAEVNGELKLPYYSIQEEDQVEMRDYYLVSQLIEYMDVPVDLEDAIYVNNKKVGLDEKVYKNFSIDWAVIVSETGEKVDTVSQKLERPVFEEEIMENELEEDTNQKKDSESIKTEELGAELLNSEKLIETKSELLITIIVNGSPVSLKGKSDYIFVDVFDFIDFDLTASNGRNIVTLLNGEIPQYTENIRQGDKVEIYWKE